MLCEFATIVIHPLITIPIITYTNLDTKDGKGEHQEADLVQALVTRKREKNTHTKNALLFYRPIYFCSLHFPTLISFPLNGSLYSH